MEAEERGWRGRDCGLCKRVISLGNRKSISTSLLRIEQFVGVKCRWAAVVEWLRKRYKQFGEKSKTSSS